MYERPTGSSDAPLNDSLSKRLPPGYDPLAPQGTYYVPNRFAYWQLIVNVALALALLTYGTIGTLADDLFIPSKRTRGVHLHGAAAWFMYCALVAGAAVLLSVVVDHYDRRNNEHKYRFFASLVSKLGWGFAGAALLWHLWGAFRG